VLAEEYQSSFAMRDRVLPYLDQLVRVTGETAIYCERYQQDFCVTIERRESRRQTRMVIEPGIPRPLYAGSSALAILAMFPQEEINSVLAKQPLEKFTTLKVAAQKEILKKLEAIRQRGYAVSVQERYLFAAGVAVPCLLDENIIGSIAELGPAERVKASGIEKIGKTVRKCAAEFAALHANGGMIFN
jgi:IclR family transcriptional regulator, acetate operon repressor